MTNKIEQVIESAVKFGVRQALKEMGDMPLRDITTFLNVDPDAVTHARRAPKVTSHASKEETRSSKNPVSEAPKAVKKAVKKPKAVTATKASPKAAKKVAPKASKKTAKAVPTVQRRLSEEEVVEQVEAAKKLLVSHGSLTRGLVMEKLGASPSTTNVVLKRLLKLGYTKQSGTKRNTVYNPTAKALHEQSRGGAAKTKTVKGAKAGSKKTVVKAPSKKAAKATKAPKATKVKASRSAVTLDETTPTETEDGLTLDDMFETHPASDRRPAAEAEASGESALEADVEPEVEAEPHDTETVLDEPEAKAG